MTLGIHLALAFISWHTRTKKQKLILLISTPRRYERFLFWRNIRRSMWVQFMFPTMVVGCSFRSWMTHPATSCWSRTGIRLSTRTDGPNDPPFSLLRHSRTGCNILRDTARNLPITQFLAVVIRTTLVPFLADRVSHLVRNRQSH